MSEETLPSFNKTDNPSFQKVFSDEKLRALIIKKKRAIYIPSSTYRIQLNKNFTFKDATQIIPYLKQLGIDAVYCSPFLQATPGSLHGYDVAQPEMINEEIGTWEDFQTFSQTISENSMGIIADIVPNHMGIAGNNNTWWQDVLENGQSSKYANYFDIDWTPVAKKLRHKVLLPVLGNFYGKVLENQELRLHYLDGEFFITYYDKKFPIDPQSYSKILKSKEELLHQGPNVDGQDHQELLSIITAFKNLPTTNETDSEKIIERNREKEISKRRLKNLAQNSSYIKDYIDTIIALYNGNKESPSSFDLMDDLLNVQVYYLAYWAVASQEINYRRFFDINELAAIHTEDETVFQHYHKKLFELVRNGMIQGFRIDHPDGLYDPAVYFRKLQTEYLYQMILNDFTEGKEQATEEINATAVRKSIETLLKNEFPDSPAFYTVVEKILERKEPLPSNWLVNGTVGYDYLNALNGLFVDQKNENNFADIYERFIGHKIDYEKLTYDKKKFLSTVLMGSEINSLGHRLKRISESNRNYRDFTLNELTIAIATTIATFSVYRTYLSANDLKMSDKDREDIERAINKARDKTPMLNQLAYDFLQDVLLLNLDIDKSSEEMKMYMDFILRFQQLTGPIMAKAVEDTSFYVYNRLVSLNEVGGDPFYFGYSSEDFHDHNLNRVKNWPSSMLTTSTHDTKRSEDCRMRINVLSEIPTEWQSKINEWHEINLKFKTNINDVLEPRGNTEYFIYQTLLGTWPDETPTNDDLVSYKKRIWSYILKSLREAKIYTNWIKPNHTYENAVEGFINLMISQSLDDPFFKSFLPFQKKISFLGKLNSISATLAKIGSPGEVS